MENKKEGILDIVYKFLNRKNLYASRGATTPHAPSISMESVGDTEPYDVLHLTFNEQYYLIGFYWEKNQVFWNSFIIPMEEYPEAYEMFFGKYEKLPSFSGFEKFGEKFSKEEIDKYREELEQKMQERKERKEREKMIKQKEIEIKEEPQKDYTVKHDKGKPNLLQVPVSAIRAISEVMDYGSKKYAPDSWKKVEVERYLQATARHLYAMQDIDKNGKSVLNPNKKDDESGIEHIKHLICNCAFIIELMEKKDE